MINLKDKLTLSLERFRQNTPGKFKAALIDMDGTLYDSMKNHTAAWHRMMLELGIDEPRENFYLYEGMTGSQTINRLFTRYLNREATPEEVKEYYMRKTEYFKAMPAVSPMPGAAKMLCLLYNNGIDRVLVTGSGQRSLIDRLNRDFPGMFADNRMITSLDVVHGKPDPEPYLRAMELAGVTAAESIVIENAPLGVKAGASAGAFTIALTTGPIPFDALSDAGADIVLPSMESLADFIPLIVKY